MRASDCIIDIGSASVGACMTDMGGEKPVVSKTIRVQLSDGSTGVSDIATRAVQALDKALDTLKAMPPPKHVRITLAAPWYDGKIRTIVSNSEKPVRVTTATIERSVKEYLAQKNEGTTSAGRRKIESVVTQAYINGYPSALKRPMVGTGLKINYYESEADEAFLKSLTDSVLKVFPHAEVTFHSFALLACLVLRMARSEDNFVMVDVGGEITDIVVAHHDGLRYIGTFPVGTLSIIRTVAGSGSVADATSRLVLFAKNELSGEEMIAMENTFKTATESWSKEYTHLLEAAVKEVGIPQTTFLCADKDELKWLVRLVSGTHGVFSSRAIPVTPDFFQTSVSLGDGALYDAFLNFQSVFFNSRKQDLIEL